MTEKQSEEWDSRVLVTVDGRSYLVSPETQEDYLEEMRQERLLKELVASETLRRLFVSHDLLEA